MFEHDENMSIFKILKWKTQGDFKDFFLTTMTISQQKSMQPSFSLWIRIFC